MIFARYTGMDKQFTRGKVYPAMPEVESGDIVSYNFIEVISDFGKIVRVHPTLFYSFEFLKEVYAVVVKAFEDLEVGRVVVLSNAYSVPLLADNNNKWQVASYEVKGFGLRSQAGLEILDRTNLSPGMVIMDVDTEKWETVSIVDECMWVTTHGEGSLRTSPEQFMFAVDREGDILVEPMVTCTNDGGREDLTNGRRYIVTRGNVNQGDVRIDTIVHLINDLGKEDQYWLARFEI
jgi:hypothetical protein